MRRVPVAAVVNDAGRSTPTGPPGWLIGCKVLLAALLVLGAVAPGVGGFAGKGMVYRLPLFLAPGLAVTLWWWRRGGRYPTALDAALTLPFLLDTMANAVGLYDHVRRTDDVLHFLNWFILIAGITHTVATSPGGRQAARWLVWLAGFGLGAAIAVAWETAEYLIMRSGVGGLSLTYADTIGDLLLSTTGGAAGAWAALLTSRDETEPAVS
jgi:hypothetical protein